MSYVKLFSDILASTIWAEPNPTRLVWITMLAMADRDGFVGASIPGLAHIARVSADECRLAIESLAAPDPDSRTKDHEGRRIAQRDGGWVVLNYEKHRDRATLEERREKDRQRQERKRQRDALSRDVTESHKESQIPYASEYECTVPSGVQRESARGERPDDAMTNQQPSSSVTPRHRRHTAVTRPTDVSEEVWEAFLAVRKRKRAPLTPIAWDGIVREAKKAGWAMEAVLQKCAERNWQSFEADWVTGGKEPRRKQPHTAEDFGKIDYGQERAL